MIDCPYTDKCEAKGTLCSHCEHNKQQSYYIPITPYVHYVPIPYDPLHYVPAPFWAERYGAGSISTTNLYTTNNLQPFNDTSSE